MNKNGQKTIKEHVCWVLFCFCFLVTFPQEQSEFNVTFLLTRQYAPCGTTVFAVAKRSLHFTALSHTNFYWTNIKFCNLSEQILLFNPVFETTFKLAAEWDIWHQVFWLMFSAKFAHVFMAIMMAGPLVLRKWLYKVWAKNMGHMTAT